MFSLNTAIDKTVIDIQKYLRTLYGKCLKKNRKLNKNVSVLNVFNPPKKYKKDRIWKETNAIVRNKTM